MTGEWREQSSGRQSPGEVRRAPRPSTRHRFSSILQTCCDELKLAADQELEFYARNNALARVAEGFDVLWEIRNEFGDSFAALVNSIQSVFYGRDVEDFTSEQVLALLRVCEMASVCDDFDDSTLIQLTRELVRGKLDVFREIE